MAFSQLIKRMTALSLATLAGWSLGTPETCWVRGFTREQCCSAIFGPQGNAYCWDGGSHTFETCCGGTLYRSANCTEFVSDFAFSALKFQGDALDLCATAMERDRVACNAANITSASCPACAVISGGLLVEYIQCLRQELERSAVRETGGEFHRAFVGGQHFPTLLRPRSPRREFAWVVPAFDAYVGSQLLHEGHWMPQEVALLIGLLPRGGLAVDAGANLGGFTIPFAQQVGPLGQVHAFEPFRLIYQLLTANCALNGLQSCFTHHRGLGAEARRTRLRSPGLNAVGNPSKMFVAEKVASELHVHYDERLEEDVEVVPLDALALPRLDLLKIEVESMELELLHGAEATLRRCRPVIFVEDSEAPDMAELRQPTRVMRLLHEVHRYACINLVQSGLDSMTSLLCSPVEKLPAVREHLAAVMRYWRHLESEGWGRGVKTTEGKLVEKGSIIAGLD